MKRSKRPRKFFQGFGIPKQLRLFDPPEYKAYLEERRRLNLFVTKKEDK